MTKIIYLTNGGEALVDDADYDIISKYKWYGEKNHLTTYARRTDSAKPIRMHNMIMGEYRGQFIDHISRNGLDNTRCNLRFVLYSDSNMNRGRPKHNTSGYKGVVRVGKKWRAQVQVNGKGIHLGMFDTPEEANSAREKFAPTTAQAIA